MNIKYRFFVTCLLLMIGMTTASASYTPTAQDCATVDYNKQVQTYTEQMDAAGKMGMQDLVAQARHERQVAQENADVCASLATQPATQPQ